MKEGDKVRVHCAAGWNEGAARSLDGMVGVIKEHKPTNYLGFARESPFLVEFPERPKPWHSNQIPSNSWWFAEHELELVESCGSCEDGSCMTCDDDGLVPVK